ncbi:MAG: ISAs1 family transposase [bacterium]|nr:ISAs1 family transposase [bacterium]
MFAAVLDSIAIAGKTISADALLTQRKLASYLIERQAHYHFTVKGNQRKLQDDIALLFHQRGAPHHVDVSPPDHGRVETRRIWCSTALNTFLDFPHVGQVFMIEREVLHKKSGQLTTELALGITSHTPEQASPKSVLTTNRGHWVIENSCHYVIDWNFHEDRSRICAGHGPANVSRLRRFAVGVLKAFSDGNTTIAEKMRRLNRNTRLVFDYLRMTKNSTRSTAHASG